MSPTCKNCDHPSEGKFCVNCGQKNDIHRLTVGHAIHEFVHALTHTDKGFLLLVKDLLVKPGVVALEFVNGKRKKYFNPFSFLVITTAASALITFKSGYLAGATNGRPDYTQPYFKEAMELSINYGKYIGLILVVPLYTILSKLFFWKPSFNFVERFVLQSYGIGMYYIATCVVFVPLFLLIPGTFDINNLTLHFCYVAYMGFAYHQFFKQNLFITLLKSFIMAILFVAVFWFLLVGYVYLKHLILPH